MSTWAKFGICRNISPINCCGAISSTLPRLDSVEAVVSGGDNNEIATQILNTKAGGISSYGNTEVDLKLNSGESLTIRFTRPN